MYNHLHHTILPRIYRAVSTNGQIFKEIVPTLHQKMREVGVKGHHLSDSMLYTVGSYDARLLEATLCDGPLRDGTLLEVRDGTLLEGVAREGGGGWGGAE